MRNVYRQSWHFGPFQGGIGRPFAGLRSLGILVFIGVLALAGCASPAAPASQPAAPAAQATATEPPAPQVLPAAGATPAAPAAAATGTPASVAAAASAASMTKAAMVKLGSSDKLGQFLVDEQGLTLYLYTKDTQGTKDTPGTSNCYDKCEAAWPVLFTNGAPKAGDGVDASLLGTTTRKDGKIQVTYNGWPLYYYVKDQKVGDVTGQDVGKVWYVISPKGEEVETPASASSSTGSTAAATGTPASVAAMVKLGSSDKLGQFLVDEQGLTLYLYTKDTQGTKDTPGTSNCYDKCEAAWPVLFTNGAPKAGDGVDASLLGTTTRKDGKIQVTYNGWPLYYYVKDLKVGDVTGQDVGKVWYVISPKGEEVETPASASSSSAPAAAAQPPAQSADDKYGKPAGSDDNSKSGGQSVTIKITNFLFGGGPLTIAPGTTVEWENEDSAPHTVTADDGSFDSGNMNKGATFKHTFTQEGTFAYYCAYHGGPGGTGMASKIIVKK